MQTYNDSEPEHYPINSNSNRKNLSTTPSAKKIDTMLPDKGGGITMAMPDDDDDNNKPTDSNRKNTNIAAVTRLSNEFSQFVDDDAILNKMEKLNNSNSHNDNEFSPIYDGGFHKGLWKAKYDR